MSAYTPGPWRVLADTQTGAVDVWSGGCFVCTVGANANDEAIVPDAHLIATAPELLQWIKERIDECGHNTLAECDACRSGWRLVDRAENV